MFRVCFLYFAIQCQFFYITLTSPSSPSLGVYILYHFFTMICTFTNLLTFHCFQFVSGVAFLPSLLGCERSSVFSLILLLSEIFTFVTFLFMRAPITLCEISSSVARQPSHPYKIQIIRIQQATMPDGFSIEN